MTMTAPIQVRLATPVDAPEIVAFNQAMALETEDKVLADGVVSAGVCRVFTEPALGFYLVAEEAETVIGTLMGTKE